MTGRDPYPEYPGELPPAPATPPPGPRPPAPQHHPGPAQHPQQPPPGWGPAPAPPEPPGGPPRRPRTVTLAVVAMVVGGLVALATGLVSLTELSALRADLAVEVDDEDTLDVLVPVLAGGFVVFGVLSALAWWWMAWKNGQGRGWARITATVLGALNIVSTASTLALVALGTAVDTTAMTGQGFGASPPSLALQVVSLLVSVVALVLLWVAPSRRFHADVSRWRTWQRWSAARGTR